MSDTIAARHGIHVWNTKTGDYRADPLTPERDGGTAAWYDLHDVAEARWGKFLYPDHTRADLQIAKSLGMKTIWRAPDEGFVHWRDVAEMIHIASTELDGSPLDHPLADVIEVGNEPYDGELLALWQHAQYLEWVWALCGEMAAKAKILLITGGWRNKARLPKAGDKLASGEIVPPELAQRLRDVYARFPGHGLHVYDVHRLVGTWRRPGQQRPANAPEDAIDLINDWISDMHAYDVEQGHKERQRRYFVTEYGIAARLLAGYDEAHKAQSDIQKADRYYSFLAALPLYASLVECATAFGMGLTRGFHRFDDPNEYSPTGHSSYTLSHEAWAHLARRVRF